jgi:acylphosphatase
MSDELEAFNVIISGKVQGVFFRASMKQIAEENNIVGWVGNLDNGTVEALIQGRRSDVVAVLDWCNAGPKDSIVSEVKVTRLKVEPSLRNFAVLI